MILFLPINGPLLRIGFQEVFGKSVPIGEFYFFALCIILFVLGGFMTFTPKLKSPFQESMIFGQFEWILLIISLI